MPLSMYHAAVPAYARGLTALAGILDKGATHAHANGVEPATLIAARLAPDMWPLGRQVRGVANHATRGPARLAGLSPPEFDGADATFDDLKARLEWARAFVNGVDPAAMDAGEDHEITFPIGGEQQTLTGREYLLGFSLPNFYFHLTTAYDILRHKGVPLAKADFIGKV